VLGFQFPVGSLCTRHEVLLVESNATTMAGTGSAALRQS
jgi:hypothetical protein